MDATEEKEQDYVMVQSKVGWLAAELPFYSRCGEAPKRGAGASAPVLWSVGQLSRQRPFGSAMLVQGNDATVAIYK